MFYMCNPLIYRIENVVFYEQDPGDLGQSTNYAHNDHIPNSWVSEGIHSWNGESMLMKVNNIGFGSCAQH